MNNFGNHSGDLFSEAQTLAEPLASRMRPENLDELEGHEKVVGLRTPLRNWIERDQVPSLILWGPPGCGKTTVGSLIAKATRSRFKTLSAVSSGVKDIREAAEEARLLRSQAKTYLFVDEVHRFNKSQQDALLPHVESGVLTLIGATTENPSFELNSALLSRVRVLRFEPLSDEALVRVLSRALKDPVRGYAGQKMFEPEALLVLAKLCDGDARRALTLLETVVLSDSEKTTFSKADVEAALDTLSISRTYRMDRAGEEHYNIASALIKSIRDSDPHAGVYYLARMIEAGEDATFIARRLVILASEDVGNADPRALQIAITGFEAVERIGMPESRIILSQVVTYLACAPKSNAAYEAIDLALAEVRASGSLETPLHLRNATTKLMKAEGYGQGYQYAHAKADTRAKQQHLPKQLIGKRFYFPKDIGYEKYFKEKLDQIEKDFE